jgi:hypothetical protein
MMYLDTTRYRMMVILSEYIGILALASDLPAELEP